MLKYMIYYPCNKNRHLLKQFGNIFQSNVTFLSINKHCLGNMQHTPTFIVTFLFYISI